MVEGKMSGVIHTKGCGNQDRVGAGESGCFPVGQRRWRRIGASPGFQHVGDDSHGLHGGRQIEIDGTALNSQRPGNVQTSQKQIITQAQGLGNQMAGFIYRERTGGTIFNGQGSSVDKMPDGGIGQGFHRLISVKSSLGNQITGKAYRAGTDKTFCQLKVPESGGG